MPGKILGLQIDDDAVTAVVVKSGFKETRITGCGRAALGEGGFDEALGVLAEGMDLRNDAVVVSIPAGKAALHTVRMPFSDSKKIRQALPYEMESLMPFAVETMVTDFIKLEDGPEPQVLAASVSSETVSEILAGLQSRDLDAQVLDLECIPTVAWLLRRPQTPDDGLFLHIGIRRHTMVLFLQRRVVLVRSLGAVMNEGNPIGALTGMEGAEIRDPESLRTKIEEVLEDLARHVVSTVHAYRGESGLPAAVGKIYYSGPGGLFPDTGHVLARHTGLEAEPVDVRADKAVGIDKAAASSWSAPLMNGALALTLRNARNGGTFNFRKGAFEIKTPLLGSLRRLRTAGVLTCVFLVLWMVSAGLEYGRLQKRHNALEAGMVDVFRRTFPDATRIVDPLQQMKVRVMEEAGSRAFTPGIGADTEVLGLIRDISARVPEDVDVRITVMTIDQETVRISGRTGDFNLVDGIKNSLEPSEYFSDVTISSANMDRSGRHVQFELRLQRARGGAA